MAGIYKRGKTYWARAQRNGREFRESLKTGDRRVAEKRYDAWKAKLEALAWGDRTRVTFSEAVRAFITEYFINLKPSSQTRYGVSLKALADVFEGCFIDQIQRDMLNRFETSRRSQGVSPPTVRRDLACLSSMLAFCEEKEWLDEGFNPVPGYLKRRSTRGLKEAPGRTRYLTIEEEESLLAHATPAVRTALMVAIDTGLRDQEQFTLTWGQVDFKRSVIRTTTNTKSGRSRTVPLPARSAVALAQIQAQQSAQEISTIFVFAHEDGSRILRQVKGMKAAARRATEDKKRYKDISLDDIRWHDLRRTAGCRWLQRDKLSMIEVCNLLGHSSVTVTEKSYAFLEGEVLAQEVAKSR
ncbi:tyrosine-type recombinase/integrase [Roseibium album]|uniref:tyrosine-type recombinase/integrase n=1 Tax=Roseibium album TaxID=311410 RepID=UPI003BAF7D0E